jgi:hypothetical protein
MDKWRCPICGRYFGHFLEAQIHIDEAHIISPPPEDPEPEPEPENA